ncbi:MAG TPA: hypothetical protein VL020_07840 [Pseudomonadales bacterium]|nr:hypothetical protein [Pseudomonadales bacterium]
MPYSNTNNRKYILIIWLFVCIALILNIIEMWQPLVQIDDAYISYRYALNLVDGHGLVFNKGEYVEGYTNLLWTLLVALGVYSGLSAPEAGHILMIASSVFMLLSTFLLVRAILPEKHQGLAVLAPFAVLANNAFASWSVSGLETVLFSGLVALALFFHIREKMLCTALVCILAAMTRPEGALLAGVLLGGNWLIAIYNQKRFNGKDILRLSMPCLLFAVYLIMHTTFRYYYYNDVVPNTFYAKVGGLPASLGFYYVYNFLIDGPGLLVIPFLLACVVDKKMRLMGVYVLFTISYVIMIGGDAFKLGRFLLPLLPILIAGTLVCSAYFLERRKWLGALVAALVVLSSLLSLYGPWREGIDFTNRSNATWPESDKRISARNHIFGISDETLRAWTDNIRLLSPQVNKIATVGIGKLGYFLMDKSILDLVGLTSKEVAKSSSVISGAFLVPGHQRTNANYILSQEPDVIWLPKKPEGDAPSLPAVKELWESRKLEDFYYWDESIELYRRKQLN